MIDSCYDRVNKIYFNYNSPDGLKQSKDAQELAMENSWILHKIIAHRQKNPEINNNVNLKINRALTTKMKTIESKSKLTKVIIKRQRWC